MTEEDRNQKVVKAYWEAFNRGDVPAALAFWVDPVMNVGSECSVLSSEKVLRIYARAPRRSFAVEELAAVKENVIGRGQY